MEYEIKYENMQPKLIFPACDQRKQASIELGEYILREITKHQFTLSEIRGLLAWVSDTTMAGAVAHYTR